MLLALIVLSQALPSEVGAWRDYDEVFDIARVGDTVYAATDGGLLAREGAAWKPVASPSMVREIVSVSPFVIRLADGRTFAFEGSSWRERVAPPRAARSLAEGTTLQGAASWIRPAFEAPSPPATPYCALTEGGRLLAGTADGLFGWTGQRWVREALPSDLPLMRPNGIVSVGGEYVVGGLGGLYIGTPGAWRQASGEAVRQISKQGDDVWVVYGSGAVDKLEPQQGRLYPDVWHGAARRPWSACVAEIGGKQDFGGQGGWIERAADMTENYPSELSADIVMAIEGRGPTRWVGTEKSGLLRYGREGVRHWNPGNGLTDPSVTALCLNAPRGLVVGTATQGLFRVVGNEITAVPSPTMRITKLALWDGRLVVGGMDGAWIQRGSGWSELPTDGEETTALTVMEDGRLAVTTATGVHFLK